MTEDSSNGLADKKKQAFETQTLINPQIGSTEQDLNWFVIYYSSTY